MWHGYHGGTVALGYHGGNVALGYHGLTVALSYHGGTVALVYPILQKVGLVTHKILFTVHKQYNLLCEPVDWTDLPQFVGLDNKLYITVTIERE